MSDTKRIYPSWNFDRSRGIAFDVPANSKLDTNRPVGDVMRIFEKEWGDRPNKWPRTVTLKGRTMTDLGPWWQCNDCKKHFLEWDGELRWTSPSLLYYCESCVMQYTYLDSHSGHRKTLESLHEKAAKLQAKKQEERAARAHAPSLFPRE